MEMMDITRMGPFASAQVFWLLTLVVLGVVVVSGYSLAMRGLFPRFVERSSRRWRKPWLDLAVGLIVGGVLILMGRGMLRPANAEISVFLGRALMGVPIFIGVIGLSGLASRIGGGLRSNGEDLQSWRGSLRGGIVLGMLVGLPLVGPTLILPLLLAGGVGNALFSLRSGAPSSPPKSIARTQATPPDRPRPSSREQDSGGRRGRPPRRGRPGQTRGDRERPGRERDREKTDREKTDRDKPRE